METINLTTLNARLADVAVSGYIWMSDATKPTVYDDTTGVIIPTMANPFIIEGWLYDKHSNTSYDIRTIDGTTVVRVYALDTLRGERQEQTFLPSFGGSPGKLHFLQYWREKADPMCESMYVLQPAEWVFAGFINKEED